LDVSMTLRHYCGAIPLSIPKLGSLVLVWSGFLVIWTQIEYFKCHLCSFSEVTFSFWDIEQLKHELLRL